MLEINGREIGGETPPYVVAEISANHNGRLDRAVSLIEAAKEAGADAVKIQTYRPDTITIDHDGPGFIIEEGPWEARKLYDLYAEAHTPWEWHEELFDFAHRVGITLFSSPFDVSAVEFLEDLRCPAYKIASFELVDIPLIELVAVTGKPLILSTGMASQAEIGAAVTAARSAGCSEMCLLHCISAYPAQATEFNLLTLPDIAATYGVVPGLSDHSMDNVTAVTAVALGAAVVEKHLTLQRDDGGPDAEFSLEPKELARLCRDVRTAWAAKGTATYRRPSSEAPQKDLRRSLYVVEDIEKGERFSEAKVRSIRPGRGLAPSRLKDVLGRRAACDLPRGTPLQLSHLTPPVHDDDHEALSPQ